MAGRSRRAAHAIGGPAGGLTGLTPGEDLALAEQPEARAVVRVVHDGQSGSPGSRAGGGYPAERFRIDDSTRSASPGTVTVPHLRLFQPWRHPRWMGHTRHHVPSSGFSNQDFAASCLSPPVSIGARMGGLPSGYAEPAGPRGGSSQQAARSPPGQPPFAPGTHPRTRVSPPPSQHEAGHVSGPGSGQATAAARPIITHPAATPQTAAASQPAKPPQPTHRRRRCRVRPQRRRSPGPRAPRPVH